MTFPDIDSLSTYGGAKTDYPSTLEYTDGTTDRAASDANKAWANVAMMTRTANLATFLIQKSVQATHAAVRAASTGNVTLNGPQTLDTIACVAGDRVLCKNQTTASENGVYVVAAGAWSRSTDLDASAEFVDGVTVYVTEGSTNIATYWRLETAATGAITLGATTVTFLEAYDIIYQDAAWSLRSYAYRTTLQRYSTTVFYLNLPSTVLDELDTLHTFSAPTTPRGCVRARVLGGTAVDATATFASNRITVRTFDMAGAAVALGAKKLLVELLS